MIQIMLISNMLAWKYSNMFRIRLFPHKHLLVISYCFLGLVTSMKLIIDTDPGVDDAAALFIGASTPNVEILAITSVAGNVGVEKTTKNVLTILQTVHRDEIRVYNGTPAAILTYGKESSPWFGHDGLCDVLHIKPSRKQLERGKAIDAINRLAALHPGEITFVAIGPLTNLALAHRFNPKLSSQLKEVVIMGGAVTHKMNPEFNFASDPVAARIVLEELSCPKYLVPFELSGAEFYTPPDIVEKYCSFDTDQSRFMKKVLHGYEVIHGSVCVSFYDAVAMTVALERSIATKMTHVHTTVSIDWDREAGSCIFDWTGTNKKKKNVFVVEEIDYLVYRDMFLRSMH